MSLKNVKIRLKPGKRGTRVWLDGVEVAGVREVKVDHAVDDVPHVRLDLIPEEVDVAGAVPSDEVTVVEGEVETEQS